uniref:Small ribosomal subunit protein uS4c n=1 Tax=Codium simulans TaxID=589376 RepID=A0A1I9LKG6_9CHLO|nr:30S ribosomal protein S4 [Codium simulans]ANJ70827.1 30S ribosomal protein S4 [Codium simulans]
MSRYRGPKLKIIRRLGNLPALTQKTSKKKNPPGQHGKQTNKPSTYAIRLIEKQKLKYNYALNEKKLYSYIKKARRSRKSTTQVLLQLLEMRLDNILYRAGVTHTIGAARQLINHAHILVNNKKMSIPSYHCQINDVISYRLKNKHSRFKKSSILPSFLEINELQNCLIVKNIISRSQILLKIDELLVIEFYSKN